MGTVLDTEQALLRIQRSSAIEYVAEVFYDELQYILGEELDDRTMVRCHGMNRRVKSKDVLSVTEHFVTQANTEKKYVNLNLARNSIYHQLPELLFHPLVVSTPGMSNKEVVAAIRANEKQDKELIKFFSPFDTGFFKERVKINDRHLNFFSNPKSRKNLIRVIDAIEIKDIPISQHQKYKLFLFLCKTEQYKENLPEIEKIIQVVLGLCVRLQFTSHTVRENVYDAVGAGILGHTLGLNGDMVSETDDVSATLILDTPTDDIEEVNRCLSNVRTVLDYFILSARNVNVDYIVRGETDLILGRNRLGYNTNI